MRLVRISAAEALPGYRLRLTLTDGRIIDRAVEGLLVGPAFELLRADERAFARVRVSGGTSNGRKPRSSATGPTDVSVISGNATGS